MKFLIFTPYEMRKSMQNKNWKKGRAFILLRQQNIIHYLNDAIYWMNECGTAPALAPFLWQNAIRRIEYYWLFIIDFECKFLISTELLYNITFSTFSFNPKTDSIQNGPIWSGYNEIFYSMAKSD